MLHFTWEPLGHLLNSGLLELGARSWEEIGIDKDLFEYNPNWPRYQSMELQDMLRFMAVRDKEGMLVGYASILLCSNLHDHRVISAYIQDIYLEPEVRKGFAPFREFIGVILRNLKILKVDHVTIGERENDDRGGVGSVYRRVGFQSSERLWTLNLRKA